VLLYWNADTRAVPHVRGIAGLARLTPSAHPGRGNRGEPQIAPFFRFTRRRRRHRERGRLDGTPLAPRLSGAEAARGRTPAPAEERERAYLLEKQIPAHEREHYPMPTFFERDVLTNKGTFFAAKREDQMVERRIQAFHEIVDLNELPLAELTAKASRYLRQTASR
jgi:hypothetical protein